MRNRVDRSRGVNVPHVPLMATTNLIQKFSHGLGLSRLFQIKERTPSPVFGSEVVPVVVIDELLKSAYPPRQSVHGGTTQGPGAVGLMPRWSAIRCRGNFFQPNVEDRVVVHDFYFHNGSGFIADLFFFCGFDFDLFTTVVSTNCFVSNPAGLPVGFTQTDFTHFVTGEDAAAIAVTPPRFTVPANQTVRFTGPWVISPGQVVGVRSTGAITDLTAAFFNCTEYPAGA